MEWGSCVATIVAFYKIPDTADIEVPDTAGWQTRRRRTQTFAKCYAFHANLRKSPQDSWREEQA